jgi:anti-sigma factor ChrR (cupin superfamily)
MNLRSIGPDFHSSGEPEESAALYAAGAMDQREARAFEEHLAAGCDRCCGALKDLATAVNALLAGIEPVAPSPAARARVLDSINARPWTAWSPNLARDGLFTLPEAAQGEWQATGFAGVWVRRLFVDAANDRVTALFKLEPGTSYPAHRHAGAEECLVVEGDLRVGDDVLQRGDYQRAAAGSRHPVQSTTGGCVLLIAGSMRDELLRDCA